MSRIFALSLLAALVSPEGLAEETPPPFVPTDRWRPVDGRPIPPGLHVRMDFRTGKVEAKLLDPDEKSEGGTSVAVAEIPNEPNQLAELEHLLRQYDSALDFVQGGGLERVIYPHLRGDDVALKTEALRTLAACLQNNAPAKERARETGLEDLLVGLLSGDPDPKVQTGAVRALGALLRGGPPSDAREALRDLVVSGGNPPARLVALTLLDDLASEAASPTPVDEEFCDAVGRLPVETATRGEETEGAESAPATFSGGCGRRHRADAGLLRALHGVRGPGGEAAQRYSDLLLERKVRDEL